MGGRARKCRSARRGIADDPARAVGRPDSTKPAAEPGHPGLAHVLGRGPRACGIWTPAPCRPHGAIPGGRRWQPAGSHQHRRAARRGGETTAGHLIIGTPSIALPGSRENENGDVRRELAPARARSDHDAAIVRVHLTACAAKSGMRGALAMPTGNPNRATIGIPPGSTIGPSAWPARHRLSIIHLVREFSFTAQPDLYGPALRPRPTRSIGMR